MFLAENQRNSYRDALPYSKTKCVSWCLETKGPDVSIPPEKKVASLSAGRKKGGLSTEFHGTENICNFPGPKVVHEKGRASLRLS